MELFLDVLSETLVDTAKMLPFLFLAYLFIEYVETRHGERIETLLAAASSAKASAAPSTTSMQLCCLSSMVDRMMAAPRTFAAGRIQRRPGSSKQRLRR